jgi:hypothetical protein
MKSKPSNITVHVTRSTETIDFDAWAKRYVAACLDALQDAKQMPEAA